MLDLRLRSRFPPPPAGACRTPLAAGVRHVYDDILDRSIEELRLWVELVRGARADGLDLDHAVDAVRRQTAERYAAIRSDPSLDEKFERLNSFAANIAGINRWLDRVEGAAAVPMGDAAP